MRLFRYQGIDVKVDKLFLLMMVFYGLTNVLAQAVVIFGVVFVHELAHTLMARNYNVKISEIVLFPFGGIARLDFLEVDSKEELRIAIIGPLTNLFMAGLAMAAFYYWESDYWLPFFIRLNLIMAFFNLLPILPLDGGRIFRTLSSQKIGVFNATKRAVQQGKLISVLLLVISASGLYLKIWDLNAVTMAGFLFYAAGEQDKTASFHFFRYLLKKQEIIAKENIQNIKTYFIRENTIIKEILPHLVPNTYHLFFVFNKTGQLVATVSEQELIEEFFKNGDKVTIEKLI